MDVKLLDDWKGVLDPQARRTLQNRLNQRASRRRKRELEGKIPMTTPKPKSKSHVHQSVPVEHRTRSQNDNDNNNNALVQHSSLPIPSLDTLTVLGPGATLSRTMLRAIEVYLQVELSISPRTDLLLSLTRVNFMRAFLFNIDILGYTSSEMHDDALSQFGTVGPPKPFLTDISNYPIAPQPTTIQRNVPHHPWLDLLPIKQLRDNLILAGESYDDVRLCKDMCGYGTQLGSPAGGPRGETGMIIWKDPWDPEGWEVTESFVRRWGWVVAGCTETDRWRGVRGEAPLFRNAEGLSSL